jgi:hypothetical protein
MAGASFKAKPMVCPESAEFSFTPPMGKPGKKVWMPLESRLKPGKIAIGGLRFPLFGHFCFHSDGFA